MLAKVNTYVGIPPVRAVASVLVTAKLVMAPAVKVPEKATPDVISSTVRSDPETVLRVYILAELVTGLVMKLGLVALSSLRVIEVAAAQSAPDAHHCVASIVVTLELVAVLVQVKVAEPVEHVILEE